MADLLATAPKLEEIDISRQIGTRKVHVMIENDLADEEELKSKLPRVGSIKVVNCYDHEQVFHKKTIELTNLAEIEIF